MLKYFSFTVWQRICNLKHKIIYIYNLIPKPLNFTTMKSDWYLKSVLTIIAFALTILVLQNADIIPSATASEQISTYPDMIDVRVKDWDVYGEIDVNVRKWDLNDEIDVNIEEVGGWYIHNGVLKVQID